MHIDPFADAECRKVGRNPALWDVDATTQDRAIAAVLCHTCPVITTCGTAASDLGEGASGTWAGVWRPWSMRAPADDALAAYVAVFGEPINITPQSDHPSQQLAFEFDSPDLDWKDTTG